MLAWSQDELAERVGVLKRVILDFEKGRSLPHQETIDKIYTIFVGAGITFTRSSGKIGVSISEAADFTNWLRSTSEKARNIG